VRKLVWGWALLWRRRASFMFWLQQTLQMHCHTCLKFPCTAHDVLQSRGKEFYNTDVQCLTQHWQKCVENVVTLCKNSLIIAKYVWIVNINLTVIPVTFYEKNIGSITFVPPLIKLQKSWYSILMKQVFQLHTHLRCLDKGWGSWEVGGCWLFIFINMLCDLAWRTTIKSCSRVWSGICVD
jgi:hypothetical protein